MFFGKNLLIFWIENQFYTLKSRFVKWMIHFTPGKRHVSKIRPYFLRTFWLSAIKRAHANMRSLNNGWQPARPSKRTCVLLMPLWFFIKTEVLLGIIYWLCPDGLKQKDPVRSPLIYSIDPRPPGINVGTRFLWCFMLFNLPLLRSPLDANTTNKSSIWCIDSVGLHFMFVIFLHFFTLHSTF